jgi:hypothetical protein
VPCTGSAISTIVTTVNNMENVRVADLTRLLRDLGSPASAAARDAA